MPPLKAKIERHIAERDENGLSPLIKPGKQPKIVGQERIKRLQEMRRQWMIHAGIEYQEAGPQSKPRTTEANSRPVPRIQAPGPRVVFAWIRYNRILWRKARFKRSARACFRRIPGAGRHHGDHRWLPLWRRWCPINGSQAEAVGVAMARRLQWRAAAACAVVDDWGCLELGERLWDLPAWWIIGSFCAGACVRNGGRRKAGEVRAEE